MTGVQAQAAENFRGSIFMLLAMCSFAFGDGVIKYLGAELPLGQIIMFRGVFSILVIAILMQLNGQWKGALRHFQNKILWFRAAAEVVATYSFFTALLNLSFASVSAILQSVPLVVTLGAAMLFGEKIGWRRMAAIMLGLFGVLLIIKPGFGTFNFYSLVAVLTVFAASARDLATRKLPPDMPNFVATIFTIFAVCVCTVTIAPFEEWKMLNASEVSTLLITSVLLVVGFVGIIAAMRTGEVAVVTPFRYSHLLFATLIGVVFFSETPDIYTILGSIIVVTTGLYTFYREYILRNRQSKVASE